MKRLFYIIIILLSLFLSVGLLMDSISKAFVYHKDAGYFINTKDLEDEKVTMLHYYASEVDVYSEKKEELSLLIHGLETAGNFYINKSIVLQNHTPELDKFADQDYIRFDINKSDYIDNVATVFMDVVPSDKNDFTSFFIGHNQSISNFLISKNVLSIVVVIVAAISLFFVFITNTKNIYALMYIVSFGILFIDFEIGLSFLCTSMYFMSGCILKRKHIPKLFLLFLLISIIFLDIRLYLCMLILLKIFDFYKKYNYKTIISLVAFSILLAISVYDYELSVCRIFYEELYLISFTIFSGLYSIEFIRNIFKRQNSANIQLLRGMSHDFKIPLSVLRLNMEILDTENFDTQAKRNSIINSSITAIGDLEKMISSLTAYLSKDDYVSDKYSSSLTKCFEKIENSFKLRDEKIDFIVNYDDDDVFLNIDEIWLDRLIYNLVDNAFKYSKEYGMVSLSYKNNGKNVVITVEDTGIGMSKEEVKKSFIPFYRADKSRGIAGLGLGLSIIKNTIEKLDAEIDICSEVDEGTKVIIKI